MKNLISFLVLPALFACQSISQSRNPSSASSFFTNVVNKFTRKKGNAAANVTFGSKNSIEVKEMSNSIKKMMDEEDIPISSQFDKELMVFSKDGDEKAFMKIFNKAIKQKLKKFNKSSSSYSKHDNLKETVLNSLRSIFDPRFPSSERLNALAYVYSGFSPMLAKMERRLIEHPEDWFFNKTMRWALNNCVGDALKLHKKEDVLKEIQKIVRTKEELYNPVSDGLLVGRAQGDFKLPILRNLLINHIENREAFDLMIELFAQMGFKRLIARKHSSGDPEIITTQFMNVMRRYKKFHGVSMQSDPDFVLSSNNILYAIIHPELMYPSRNIINLPLMIPPTAKDMDLFNVRTFLFQKSRMQNGIETFQTTEDVHFLIRAMLFELKNESNIDSVHTIFKNVQEALVASIKTGKIEDDERFVEIMYNNGEFAQWVNDIRARL